MSDMYRSAVDLAKLPNQAVVVDHENRVWEKYAVHRWATPGLAGTFPVDDIALPARLLDDGL